MGIVTQHCVLGYFQPSLRDLARYTLMAVLFSISADEDLLLPQPPD